MPLLCRIEQFYIGLRLCFLSVRMSFVRLIYGLGEVSAFAQNAFTISISVRGHLVTLKIAYYLWVRAYSLVRGFGKI